MSRTHWNTTHMVSYNHLLHSSMRKWVIIPNTALSIRSIFHEVVVLVLRTLAHPFRLHERRSFSSRNLIPLWFIRIFSSRNFIMPNPWGLEQLSGDPLQNDFSTSQDDFGTMFWLAQRMAHSIRSLIKSAVFTTSWLPHTTCWPFFWFGGTLSFSLLNITNNPDYCTPISSSITNFLVCLL